MRGRASAVVGNANIVEMDSNAANKVFIIDRDTSLRSKLMRMILHRDAAAAS
jgi:hypothetical protein